MAKDRRLGRGLAALLGGPLEESSPASPPASPVYQAPGQQAPAHSIPVHPTTEFAPAAEPPFEETTVEQAASRAEGQGEMVLLSVHEIDENPFQPRREFNESEIVSLSESLKEHDMLQPVLVRRVGERFQLISGERRLRAATHAGWEKVPARIRAADDRLVAELAIVENLQRKDLNPIEKALSFRRYLEEHGSTQEELAGRLKIDRSTIANLMRLLDLPEEVRESLRAGDISAGHARALLPLGEADLQIDFCQQIRRQGLSVRATESLVQERILEEDAEPLAVAGRIGPPKPSKSDQIAALEQELRMALGSKVDVKSSARGRGRITIHFANHEEFDRIRALLVTEGGLGTEQPAETHTG